MYASVRAFLHEIIDYAGLFPPAKLPLDEALRNYLHYRKASPHRWMLGRFVCPATRLPELLTLAKGHEDAALLSLSVLGQQGAGVSDFFAKLDADISAIDAFRCDWDADAVIDMIEIPLPKAETVDGPMPWEALYGGYADAMAYHLHYAAENLLKADLRAFVEVPARTAELEWYGTALRGIDMSLVERSKDDLKRIATGLSSVRDHLGEERPRIGMKLRCGGVTADVFPDDEQVAFFIDRCWPAPLPWKATAGLHHPLRHWDETLQVWHHGFLNVFGAGILARAHPLSTADLNEILADRAGRHFHFDEDRFAWKDWSCTAAQIAEYRADSATAFGSCSFVEPCADLTALGLLDC